jgi:hypothetical protein
VSNLKLSNKILSLPRILTLTRLSSLLVLVATLATHGSEKELARMKFRIAHLWQKSCAQELQQQDLKKEKRLMTSGKPLEERPHIALSKRWELPQGLRQDFTKSLLLKDTYI